MITALLFAGAGLWAAVFVPREIARNTKHYGLLGVALATVSYLAVLGLMVVVGTVMGAAIHGDPDPSGSGPTD